jgi:hypothetical protein
LCRADAESVASSAGSLAKTSTLTDRSIVASGKPGDIDNPARHAPVIVDFRFRY